MSPVAVKERIAAKRLNYDRYDLSGSSFASIKKCLAKEEGFNERQVKWAIELYVNDLEEELLRRDFYQLYHYPKLHDENSLLELVNKQMILTRLCAHDCVKLWFDTNVRVLLKQALCEQHVAPKRQNYILYKICAFSPQQFHEQEHYPVITTRLPYWLPTDNQSQVAWEKGINEEYDLLCHQYRQPVQAYLAEFLHEEQAKEICQTAFDLKSGE